MTKWTWLVLGLAFGCGSTLDSKYTDEGIAAADALCACMDTADEATFEACTSTARQRLGAAEKAMIDRGYFDDHLDAAPMKTFSQRKELCETHDAEAGALFARRAAEPKPIDDAAIRRSLANLSATEANALGAGRPGAKPAPKAKPTARRSPAKKATAPTADPGERHGPLWAKEAPLPVKQ